jgi:hypothetical protein
VCLRRIDCDLIAFGAIKEAGELHCRGLAQQIVRLPQPLARGRGPNPAPKPQRPTQKGLLWLSLVLTWQLQHVTMGRFIFFLVSPIFLIILDGSSRTRRVQIISSVSAARSSGLCYSPNYAVVQTGTAALSNSRAARISKDSIGTHNSYTVSPAP